MADISSVKKNKCSGCGACVKACPKNVIRFETDQEGFPYPVVDKDKCVSCGICVGVCPAENPPARVPVAKTYAAQIKDESTLKESTSGGIFTLLADSVFKQQGVVYGCVWDDKYNAFVKRADSLEELSGMRGSKYIWSSASDTYPEIRGLLEEGKEVLFTGLPCQAAGLKKYLKKDYENLIVMDFLCSGAPSPMAFHKYLDSICSIEDRKNLNFKFRDKNPYGVGVHITYNGQKKKYSRGEHIRNPYYYAFYTHLLDRRSCYECPYGTDQRISDITVGDYWGVEKYHPDMNISAGISALMLNTEKGIRVIEQLKDSLILKETKKESISKANNLICSGKERNRSVPAIRDGFFKELNQNGWVSAEKKYLHSFARFKKTLVFFVPVKFLKLIKKIVKK